MKWSRYNILFQSQNNGWLLFNTVSRAFLTVEEAQLPIIRGIMENPQGFDYTGCAMLYFQLRSMGVLVEDDRDDAFYNVEKMRNLAYLYGESTLSLTVAVTRACNFDCNYCFEGNRTGKPMNQEVEDKLIRFIRSHRGHALYITWYGGEPLLAFDRILSIHNRLKEMGRSYNAGMITNGYLLTRDRADLLNELNIS